MIRLCLERKNILKCENKSTLSSNVVPVAAALKKKSFVLEDQQVARDPKSSQNWEKKFLPQGLVMMCKHGTRNQKIM